MHFLDIGHRESRRLAYSREPEQVSVGDNCSRYLWVRQLSIVSIVGSDLAQANAEPVAGVYLDKRPGYGDLVFVSSAPDAGGESLEGDRLVVVRRPGSPRCAVPLDLRAL